MNSRDRFKSIALKLTKKILLIYLFVYGKMLYLLN
jgi:hypothetical protein